MGQAFNFISSKEVVIFPWQKKPDVELVDPRGEVLNILLDITLPALFQQAASSGDDVYKNARKAKAKEYPLKDSEGRRNNPSPCLPFILTSMGGLCAEGHAFLKICRERNPDKADLLLDVLVTQHSRWTARRIHRALFGQSLIDFSGESWTCHSNESTTNSKISNRCKHKSHACQTHILSDFTRQFSNSNSQASPHNTLTEEECSVCSDNDHTAESSMAPCDECETDFSRKSGSTISYVGSSKPPIQCPSVAFPAAYERGPLLVPILASTLTTEFFELSPPR